MIKVMEERTFQGEDLGWLKLGYTKDIIGCEPRKLGQC
jgi:hypothetical protein